MWLTILLVVVVGIGFVALTGAPYVPSKRRDVERAFSELYLLTSKDVLVDIGSGDGKVLRIASGYGAKAFGYEIHPVLVAIAKWLSRNDSNVSVHLANFWTATLPKNTTVVYTFGDTRDIVKMYKKVESTATANRTTIAFISYAFKVGDLKPNKTVGAHHLYTVSPLQK